MYLPQHQFDILYPVEENITPHVYRSGKYVVKIINTESCDDNFANTFREINIYSQINHPCIAKYEHWTFDQTNIPIGKIALPWGEGVKDLSLEKVCGDLLSAIDILEQLGYCHNDIKYENIIFFNGYVQLIDFGLVSPILKTINGYYIEKPRFTVNHRDPQIHFDQDTHVSQPADSRVQLYAIGVLLAGLFKNMNIQLEQNYPLICKYPIIEDLTRYPVQDRPTIRQMFEKYPKLIPVMGTIIKPIYPPVGGLTQVLFTPLIVQLITIIGHGSQHVRTLFDTIDLFHRVIRKKCPHDYYTIKLILYSCLFICEALNNEDITQGTTRSDNIIIEIVDICDGIITPWTAWNHAIKYSDLKPYFFNMITVDYDPRIQPVLPQVNDNRDKNQSIRTFITSLICSLGKISSDRINKYLNRNDQQDNIQIEDRLSIFPINLPRYSLTPIDQIIQEHRKSTSLRRRFELKYKIIHYIIQETNPASYEEIDAELTRLLDRNQGEGQNGLAESKPV